jgi:hypothetical protein
MPPSSVQLGVYHVGPFDLLQLPIEPIASPWTPPTRYVAAWPGVVYQRARNQAKTPGTHVSTAFIKGSGGPAWLRTWRSRTYYSFSKTYHS